MPATSEKQRKLFGAALAAKRGAKPISKKIAKIAKSTPEKELSKMARRTTDEKKVSEPDESDKNAAPVAGIDTMAEKRLELLSRMYRTGKTRRATEEAEDTGKQSTKGKDDDMPG